MITLLEGAGVFAWPLGLCSLLAVFIIFERLIALRPARTIPRRIESAFIRGDLPEAEGRDSVAGRLLLFYHQRNPDEEQLKAYARLQVIGMERGLFILDIVISAAPLLGLLGTVTGLVQVFSQISPDSPIPQQEVFISGVALALTTTILGLAVAIPAIVFNSYLVRRIDLLAAKINVGVERMLAHQREHRLP